MREASAPFVTIIVTVGKRYATQEFLGRALHSLTRQTYPTDKFEILVVADGINCQKLVEAHDSNLIRYHEYPESQGVGFASKEGLRLANGELFARVDADDTVLPTWLEVLVSVFCNTDHAKTVAYVYGGLIVVNDATQSECLTPLTPETVFDHGAGVLFCKEPVLSVGGYSTLRNAEDYELFLRLQHQGYTGYYVAEHLYQYHRHEDNITNDVNGRKEAKKQIKRQL